MNIIDVRHPNYNILDWDKWRDTYVGGRDFINKYLEKYTRRENDDDFKQRKCVTYNPAFASTCVDEVKNAIVQRFIEIKRVGGSKSYQSCCLGKDGGVDNFSSSMNHFLTEKVMTELLIMSKVGIYIDMPQLNNNFLTSIRSIHPYLYIYPVETILSWSTVTLNGKTYYTNLLLQDTIYEEHESGLTCNYITQYRHIYLNENNTVTIDIYDDKSNLISSYILNIPKIPFICLSISKSLMEDISDMQIALLNICSSDINYILKANFPFYTEQYDPRTELQNLRRASQAESDSDGTATDASTSKNNEIVVGTTTGRRYPVATERPGFIHPSSEPLLASMKKQEQIKIDIRNILHLTITNLNPKMASAESKGLDSRTLEAGLSVIGMELKRCEDEIAIIWEQYEKSGNLPDIHYPDKYDLRTEEDRRQDAKQLKELVTATNSKTYQKEVSKKIANILLCQDVTFETLDQINNEIDSADVVISDPEVIGKDVELGLVSTETASKARGYPEGEVEKAKQDHVERLSRIAIAQSKAPRIADAQDNPEQDNKNEKKISQNADSSETGKKKVRS